MTLIPLLDRGVAYSVGVACLGALLLSYARHGKRKSYG